MSSSTEHTHAAVEETRDGWVRFAVEVRVPLRQAPIFAGALTGNDDDIVLAAEEAMRDRIEDMVIEDEEAVRAREGSYAYDLGDRIELVIEHERTVKPFLAEVMG